MDDFTDRDANIAGVGFLLMIGFLWWLFAR